MAFSQAIFGDERKAAQEFQLSSWPVSSSRTSIIVSNLLLKKITMVTRLGVVLCLAVVATLSGIALGTYVVCNKISFGHSPQSNVFVAENNYWPLIMHFHIRAWIYQPRKLYVSKNKF